MWLMIVGIVLLAASSGWAEDVEPACFKLFPWRRSAPRQYEPFAPMPSDPSQPPQDPSQPPSSNMPLQDSFASAGQGGSGSPASYAPAMFGDLLGGCVASTIHIRGATSQQILCMPSPEQAAAFKIAESESPRPQNRFYYNYNYLGNINVNPPGAVGAPVAQLHRHVLGFEKTLLDGNASIGLRLPFLKIGGNFGYEANVIGDMSISAKYALVNNGDTGNLLSGGLVMRVPTGEYAVFRNANGARNLVQQRFNDVYFQPWGGYIYNLFPNLFVHGFHSFSIPTSGADVLFMSNDVGIGYWLMRNPGGSLQGIVPTVEIHINTPFRNRGLPSAVIMPDQISITSGAYFLFARGTLGGAVGVPLAGLHTIEALASYTMRW
jgi:hypothetical protein